MNTEYNTSQAEHELFDPTTSPASLHAMGRPTVGSGSTSCNGPNNLALQAAGNVASISMGMRMRCIKDGPGTGTANHAMYLRESSHKHQGSCLLPIHLLSWVALGRIAFCRRKLLDTTCTSDVLFVSFCAHVFCSFSKVPLKVD